MAQDETQGSSARRRAVVTGASAGIGDAFARRLARDGYDLTVVARAADRLEKLAQELREAHRVTVDVLAADLTRPDDCRAVERHIEESGRVDLLVNNAGFGTIGRFAELDPNREEEEIRLNVLALARLARAALPGMIGRDQGAIINVASLAGFQPAPFNATYGATKAYVISFTESLSEELRGTSVQVQALCPGFTRTEFQARAGLDVSDIPQMAWQTAEEVVDSSLTALSRGEVVHVPGMANRMLARVVGVTPRTLLRRVAGTLMRRTVTRQHS